MRTGSQCALSENDLVVASVAGDGASFGELYDRHRAQIWSWFARRTRNPTVADDLTSETFAQALLDLRRFDAQRGSFGSWLQMIALTKARRMERRGAVDARACAKLGIERCLVSESPEVVASTPDHVRALALLEGLPTALADAVRLRVMYDLDYDEVAARLECSPTAARQRVSRGLLKMRAAFAGA